jgi:two-component system NtrC family sensor kinase
MTEVAGRSSFEVIGQIARVLNGGLAADEALRTVSATMQMSTGARRVVVWRRRQGESLYVGLTAPTGEFEARSLDTLPSPSRLTRRLPLIHGGVRVGVLELEFGTEPAAAENPLVAVCCDLLAPYLDALTRSQDLALEVASRAREIEGQRRFTSLIIDSLPVGLYVIDREYRIQVWNRKRELGTQGLRRSDVMGRPVFEVLTRQPAAQLKAEFDRVFRSGELQQAEIEVGGESSPDVRVYRISRIPMRLEGDAVSHVITIGEDVTEARQVQLKILQSEKLAAIGQLAAGVMHEINNPLATIGACVAAIDARLGEAADGTVREYLEIIDKEVDRCTRIVDGLLDFSRPKEAAPKRATPPNDLVEQTLFLLKHHRRFRRITVERQLAPDLPPVLANDEPFCSTRSTRWRKGGSSPSRPGSTRRGPTR